MLEHCCKIILTSTVSEVVWEYKRILMYVICGYKHLHPADNICPAHQFLKAKNKYINKSAGSLEVLHWFPWKSQLTTREQNKAMVTHYEMYASALHFCWPAGYLRNRRHDTRSQAGSKKTNLPHNMIRLLAAKCANSRRFSYLLHKLLPQPAWWNVFKYTAVLQTVC